VAIAISLVPPLSVVGLTFESGAWHQSLGALLLFLTNVAAILGSGTVVMALYGVHRLAVPPDSPGQRTVNRRNAIVVIAAMVVTVVIPLTATSVTIARDTLREARVSGKEVGWSAPEITTRKGQVVVLMEGPLPIPDTDPLKLQLEKRGVAPSDVQVELDPVRVVTFD
jgi:uncharacterized membrane protein